MSTQTREKAEATAPASTTATATAKPVKEAKDSSQRTGWRRLVLKKETGGFSVVAWAGFFRAIVLLADYLLAIITAVVIIPMLGAWLHQQSGAARGALSGDGTIAIWLMPLLFLVALIVAGEIVVMRSMWRWATRMIAKIRDARGEAVGADVTPKSKSTPRNRTNRKRSK
ncbi:hypothetical protein ACIQWZ_37575 [Streptomyces sp. NPDC098077]|uniref:hypothetical protein n=1 Tax=Streptomyces sp. NPDC098077 TaxID=3366093 RepID=UPI003815876C